MSRGFFVCATIIVGFPCLRLSLPALPACFSLHVNYRNIVPPPDFITCECDRDGECDGRTVCPPSLPSTNHLCVLCMRVCEGERARTLAPCHTYLLKY